MNETISYNDELAWHFHGKTIDFAEPKVMGILNVTPDSFFDGGKFREEASVLQQVEKMLSEGASIIDIGGYSTRPGATDISVQEEIDRTANIISLVSKAFPDEIISIDTFRSEVARVAFDNGATVINDVSGGTMDDNMYATVSELQTPYVLMHMRGTPQTMHEYTAYDDLVFDVINYFTLRINELKKLGLSQIILDPGFGFAKTIEQNYEIVEKLAEFKALKLPLLVGVSRKSMLWKKLGITADEALNATTAINAVSITRGAKILRVHDVKEAVETIKLVKDL